MAVTVVIKRVLKEEKMSTQLSSLIVKLRSLAMIQPGFINGQTFSCLDCKGEYLVISNWYTLEDWNKWMHSQERQDFQRRIDELTGEKTVYRYYEPVIGGISPKFNESS